MLGHRRQLINTNAVFLTTQFLLCTALILCSVFVLLFVNVFVVVVRFHIARNHMVFVFSRGLIHMGHAPLASLQMAGLRFFTLSSIPLCPYLFHVFIHLSGQSPFEILVVVNISCSEYHLHIIYGPVCASPCLNVFDDLSCRFFMVIDTSRNTFSVWISFHVVLTFVIRLS